MRKFEGMKKVLSAVLAFSMVLSYAPVTAFAVTEDGSCEHHTHDADCGYVATVEGVACGHECSDACKTKEVTSCIHNHEAEGCTYTPAVEAADCDHVHGDCNYVAAQDAVLCTCEPQTVHGAECASVLTEGESCNCTPTVTHAEGCNPQDAVAESCDHQHGQCAYREAVKESWSCGHVCTKESGCVKLECAHVCPEDNCGFVAAAGSDCTYVCEICNAPQVDEAVETAKALIENLPTVEEVSAMTYDEKIALHNGAYMAAGNAYNALTPEQQASVDTEKLMALAAFYADPNNLQTLEEIIENYNIYIAGTRVTSENAADVLGDGTVSYDVGTNTLNLNNAAITASSGSGITADKDIIIAGTGSIDASEGNCGILSSNGKVTISGNLTGIRAKNKGISANTGIEISGSIGSITADNGIISSNGDITVHGSIGKIEAGGTYNPAIKATNGKVVIRGGASVTTDYSIQGQSIQNNGLLTVSEAVFDNLKTQTVSGSGKVKVGDQEYVVHDNTWYAYAYGSNGISITESTPATYYKAGSGYAIYDGNGTLTLNNATIDTANNTAISTAVDLKVIGEGTNHLNGRNGIYASAGSLTIAGKITSIEATVYHAICAAAGDITITGTVGAIKANTAQNQNGIYASGNVDISGTTGNINAAGCGVLSQNGSIAISGTVGNVSSKTHGALHTNSGDITISGTVGTLSSTNSAGIRSQKNIEISSGCVVDASGKYGIITKEGTITNNGTLKLPGSFNINSLTTENYSGNGIVMVGTQQYIMHEGVWYAYADGSKGIKLTQDTPATYYKAGDGYAVYDANGNLTLNNATLAATEANTAAILTAVDLSITGTGTNTLSAAAASAIYGQKDVTIDGKIASIQGSINGIGAEGKVSIPGTVESISGTTGRGINAKGVAITGTVNSIEGIAGINTLNGVTISGSIGTIKGTAGSGIYATAGYVSIEAGAKVGNIQGPKYGICAENGKLSVGGTITAVDGRTTDVYAKNGVSIGDDGSLKLVNTTGNPNKLSNVTIKGGTLYLQDKGYTWNSDDNAYRCKDDKHSETTGICADCGAILDKTAPTISGIENGKTYYTTQKAILTDTYLTSVSDGYSDFAVANVTEVTVTLAGDQAKAYTVTAKDIVNNKTSVAITMKPISTLDDLIENLTVDNVKLTDKETIQDVLDAVTPIRNNECGNATQAEKDALDAIIKKCNDLLKVITDVENTISKIAAMPDPEKTEPDNETAVNTYDAAKKAYDALSEHGKELVGTENRAKLDAMLKALTAYDITHQSAGSYVKGSYKALTFTANGYFGKFTGIEIDGKAVDSKYYDAKSGSTIITLKTSYLESLSVGSHTIKVNYTDGSTDGKDTFRISTNNGNPFTGDDTHMMLFSGIAMTSLLCMAMMIVFYPRKKSKYQR